MNIFSIDDEYYDLETIHDVMVALDEADALEEGAEYYSHEYIYLTSPDIVSNRVIHDLLDALDNSCYDLVGDGYTEDFVNASLMAKVDLADVITDWVEKNAKKRYYTLVNKPTVLHITKEDLEDYERE